MADETAFDEAAADLIERIWAVFPERALLAGRYEWAGVQPVFSKGELQRRRTFIQGEHDRLVKIDEAQLSPPRATEYRVLMSYLAGYLWRETRLAPLTWRPDLYDVTGGFGILLSQPFATLDRRLLLAGERMQNVPRFFAAARTNLNDPTLVHTQLAAQRNQQTFALFAGHLPYLIQKSGLTPEDKARLLRLAALSANSVVAHGQWLEQTRLRLVRDGGRSYRLGEALFDEKFAHEVVIDRSALSIYELALTTRDDVHGRMIEIAEGLWPTYFPGEAWPVDALAGVRQVLDALSADQVDPHRLVETIREDVGTLEAFVRERDLMPLPAAGPLVIRGIKAHNGRMSALVQASGPYDPGGNTYYNVTRLTGIAPAKAQAFLREYNRRMLHILSMHEAMPGHYVQLTHADRAGSLVNRIFRNGAMTEGWGLYAERLMLEEGFGDQEPEMWLLYYKWFLRSVMNAIVDREVHVHGKSREGIVLMLTSEGFQELPEAEGKWQRAIHSQVQLSTYFAGFSEIYAFRAEMKKRLADRFDLKAFHTAFLSFGGIPVKFIREQMTHPPAL